MGAVGRGRGRCGRGSVSELRGVAAPAQIGMRLNVTLCGSEWRAFQRITYKRINFINKILTYISVAAVVAALSLRQGAPGQDFARLDRAQGHDLHAWPTRSVSRSVVRTVGQAHLAVDPARVGPHRHQA